MRIFFLLLLIVNILPGFCADKPDPARYVNLFIGTAGGAHNNPGATVPFGMVQLSPDGGNTTMEEYVNYRNGHQYDYGMKSIQGFGHLHLSGTANDPAGDISVLPMLAKNPTAGLVKSEFSHEEETATPGYYSVLLKSHGIKAELTTTLRCGLHRYTFPESDHAVIRFDLGYHNGGRPVECSFTRINDSTFTGSRFSTGYADDKKVYFAVRTSKPVRDLRLFADTTLVRSKKEVRAVGVRAALMFTTLPGEKVLMKVALSFAGIEGALEGLKEIPGWNFETVKDQAAAEWEKELGKLRIETQDEELKKKFYTAVYHCYVASTRFDDARSEYKGADGNIHKGSPVYTVFALWDTFRALHPLFTITQPERVPPIIDSFLKFYDQYGLLPVWEMAFCETHCMTGYHALPVVAEAMVKGFKGFDYQHAYEAMKASANQDIRNTAAYRRYHFVPHEESSASVTKTTEYAFDDWNLAQAAKMLGYRDDYDEFIRRSGYWRSLFDPGSGFSRPKFANGSWVPNFDPLSDHTDGKESYTEGNSWHYTFMVPQDVNGLAEAFGSRKRLVQKLDSFFVTPYPEGNYLGGMGGLIGQYAHGNQPSHGIPYIYSMAGMPWKTSELVGKIRDTFYKNQPDGIIGNEDTGSMSSWYVFNAIGLYPFNPASGEYLIVAPAVDRSEIRLPGGKVFTIKARNLGGENRYIREVILNGHPWTKSYLRHEVLVKGGTMVLIMGNQPSSEWGTSMDDLPGRQ
jgi:predicted alpha-1,2-mannosidase